MLSHQYNKSWSRISIHAPLAGSDIPSLNNLFKLLLFLSTLPSRGATRKLAGLIRYLPNFYPRSPRGERHTARGRKADILYFYPRSPRGERLFRFKPPLQTCIISIHAPLAGSDCIKIKDKGDGEIFLSTLPSRGATAKTNKPLTYFCMEMTKLSVPLLYKR